MMEIPTKPERRWTSHQRALSSVRLEAFSFLSAFSPMQWRILSLKSPKWVFISQISINVTILPGWNVDWKALACCTPMSVNDSFPSPNLKAFLSLLFWHFLLPTLVVWHRSTWLVNLGPRSALDKFEAIYLPYGGPHTQSCFQNCLSPDGTIYRLEEKCFFSFLVFPNIKQIILFFYQIRAYLLI